MNISSQYRVEDKYDIPGLWATVAGAELDSLDDPTPSPSVGWDGFGLGLEFPNPRSSSSSVSSMADRRNELTLALGDGVYVVSPIRDMKPSSEAATEG